MSSKMLISLIEVVTRSLMTLKRRRWLGTLRECLCEDRHRILESLRILPWLCMHSDIECTLFHHTFPNVRWIFEVSIFLLQFLLDSLQTQEVLIRLSNTIIAASCSSFDARDHHITWRHRLQHLRPVAIFKPCAR